MAEKPLLEQALTIAVEALAFYANPENYHAILIVPDRPCGEFADDLSRTDHPLYSRPMPGKLAREASAQLQALLPVQEKDKNMNAPAEIPTVPWPTDEGIWMGKHSQLDWFPFQTKALRDDLPSAEQLRLERESPETAPPRAILGILAQWLESDRNWPYTVKGCHPVKEWRKPTEDELKRARHFYRLDEPATEAGASPA